MRINTIERKQEQRRRKRKKKARRRGEMGTVQGKRTARRKKKWENITPVVFQGNITFCFKNTQDKS